MAEFFQDISQLLIVLGILALIVEVALLGMATLVLLFLGCALVVTGLGMTFGLLPETVTTALWSVGVITGVLSLLFWKPMKRLQAKTESGSVTSDLVGHEFITPGEVDIKGQTQMAFSGIQWQLKSEQPIGADRRVRIVRAEVGVLWVTEPE